ncbi:MAG: glutamate racemase [Deltaproteobacteria bacterium]|nr:glutamate racemase [Deltaproteobacteria bacterium]
MEGPIGIFDSGVGGLTVAREVFKILPAEAVVYFGDVGRSPYGGRSKEIIAQFTAQDVAFLTEHRVKFVICACNTASAVALHEVAGRHCVPMVGVIEPGARAAAARTRAGRVGVIGTTATINSDAYARTIRGIDPAVKVFSVACPLFVPLAEEGYIEREATRLIARDYLKTMRDVGIDTLILGCTHYPLLRSVIAEAMGDGVALIDSGEETARAARDALVAGGLLRGGEAPGEHTFYVSDVPEKFTQVAARFLGTMIDRVTRVDISRY